MVNDEPEIPIDGSEDVTDYVIDETIATTMTR